MHLPRISAVRRAALLAVMMLAAMASGALALDGDLPVVPISPDDGAVVATNPDGIPVTFSCPVYRKADLGGGFVLFGGAGDYSALLSTSPALGADGRLASKDAIVQGATAPGSAESCAVNLGAGGSVRPQEVPGTYYWQVSRVCTGCALGYESGVVRRLVLQSSGTVSLGIPPKLFAGYAVIATVAGTGLPASGSVEVQRQVGSTWRVVGRDGLVRRPAEVTVTLPGGTQHLRAVVRVGSQEIVSPTLTRTVRSNATPSPVTGGSYRGTVGAGTQSATFRVVGRTVRSFRAFVPMLCPGVTAGQFTTQIGTASIRSIRIAPDGRFVGVATVSGSSIRVRGRLVRSQLTAGRVELSVGNCTGNIRYQVRRVSS